MKLKTKSIITFFLVLLIIIGATFGTLVGFNFGKVKVSPLVSKIKQGLDLQGGVYVVYEAQTDKTGKELDEILDQTVEVFRNRVDGMGLTEPIIVKEGKNRIRVELPGAKDAKEALATIGKTAQLKFMLADGTVVVTGKDVKTSKVVFNKDTNEPIVSLGFKPEGAKAFASATERLAPSQGQIYIVLDNKPISAPRVNQKIPDGNATITGNFTTESATELANLISAGALPVDFKEVETSTLTATLGENALSKTIVGAQIGMVLLIIFMISFYRLPGVIAVVALAGYISILAATLFLLNATLTLPGIAAIILSVGMAVDANVISFERIKEEIRNGKSIRASIDAGFSKAFLTIIDSNITTCIAGVVLYNFGTGSIRGFAVNLIVGVIASMFTAVVVSRILLKSVVNSNLVKSKKMFGV